MYEIKDYSFKQAKKLGVEIKPSIKKNKKIDVFKNNKLITSIGAQGYNDFPTYLKNDGKKVADERQRLYKLRHKNDTGVAGFYANKILW
tara:strand:+ start:383 stop:649 length:267 start_codon:yes stop_codon:yes gene_type:complete